MSGQLQTLNTPPPVSVQTLLYGIYQATSSGSGGSTAWGSITGTLSNQTDLQTALNLKTNNAAAAITGGSVTGLTSFGLANADASGYGLFFQVNEVLSSPRVLSLKTNNANRTLDLSGNLTLGGNFTTTGSGTIALGGYTLTVPATGTAALLGTANAFTAANTLTLTSLGTTPTAGFSLINSTAAANGAQQVSPGLVLQGNGWRSSNSTSNTCAMRQHVLPIQGSSADPLCQWVLGVSTNGGAYTNVFTMGLDTAFGSAAQLGFSTSAAAIAVAGTNRASYNFAVSNGWAFGGDGGMQVSNGSSSQSFLMLAEANNVMALRIGANAQTIRMYGTFTDASNYRRLAITSTTGGVFAITAEGAGTGASGNVLHISSLPTSNPGPGILWNNAGTPAIGT